MEGRFSVLRANQTRARLSVVVVVIVLSSALHPQSLPNVQIPVVAVSAVGYSVHAAAPPPPPPTHTVGNPAVTVAGGDSLDSLSRRRRASPAPPVSWSIIGLCFRGHSEWRQRRRRRRNWYRYGYRY